MAPLLRRNRPADTITVMRLPFVTSVAGVSFHQPAVAHVSVGDTVAVIPEDDNPYDANAYRIDTTDGETVGHLPAAVAARLRDAGYSHTLRGQVTETVGNETLGLRVKVLAGATQETVSRPVDNRPKVHTRAGRYVGLLERQSEDSVTVLNRAGNLVKLPASVVVVTGDDSTKG